VREKLAWLQPSRPKQDVSRTRTVSEPPFKPSHSPTSLQALPYSRFCLDGPDGVSSCRELVLEVDRYFDDALGILHPHSQARDQSPSTGCIPYYYFPDR
jgi:hypothetical protein